MLVLTRKRGEAITVDGPATIVVRRITGNRVQLGIVAGNETKVLRAELQQDTDFWHVGVGHTATR